MRNITELLNTIGKQSNLRFSAEVDSKQLMTDMFVPEAIQQALFTRDTAALAQLLGVKQEIICYVSVPSRDKETPKDDNQPEPEELPDQEDPDTYSQAS